MHEVADFRSDKVARPTEEMLEAMGRPQWGNGIGDKGASVRRLERLACELTGKEAALFVVSGTMANELAVKTFTRPGDQIVLDNRSHIFCVESGYSAAVSGVQTCALPSDAGVMDMAEVEGALVARFAHTPLVLMENTHNFLGGAVLPLDYMKGLCELAHSHGAQVYLDGARIINASVKTGIPVSMYAANCDALMFCLSKGLCAPAGSMLCGSEEFVHRADGFGRMFGGMLKQPGPLAECGILALTRMVGRLGEDHENASRLAKGLRGIRGVERFLDLEEPQTNMVFLSVRGLDADAFVGKLAERKVLALHIGGGRLRWVTHNDVDSQDVDRAVQVIDDILRTG
jgi:threonine aldolase